MPNSYGSTGMGRVFDFFQGRATFFGFVFMVAGIVLAFKRVLSGGEFIALVGVIQTLVFAHSWKEDLHDQRMTQLEAQGKLPVTPDEHHDEHHDDGKGDN